MKKKLRVGFDFDGVIAYNPFRIARLPISFTKRTIFGKRKLHFYYPKTFLEKWTWALLHETSFFAAPGFNELRQMIKKGDIEAFLITGRYGYLERSLMRWLRRHNAETLFSSYHVNINDEQPHQFKQRKIKELDLDVFIDDNWDIVEYLNRHTKAQIHWVYNILDRKIPYDKKYPYLKAFLDTLRKRT